MLECRILCVRQNNSYTHRHSLPCCCSNSMRYRAATASKTTRHLLAAGDLPAAESYFAATTSPVVILKEGDYDSHSGSAVYVKGGSVCQVVDCTFEDNTGGRPGPIGFHSMYLQ